MFFYNRPKIGLALGAGGSKGLAHIGVVKVLEENVKTADLVICPKVAHIGLFNRFLTSAGTEEAISVGELAMKQSLDKVNNLINNRSSDFGERVRFWLAKIKTLFTHP